MRRLSSHLAPLLAVVTAVTAVTVLVPWEARAGSSMDAARGPAHAAAPHPVSAVPEATPAPPGADRAAPPVPVGILANPPLVWPDQWQVAVTYHSQQNWDWCDPADIEMWLQADGITLPGSDYSVQGRFWEYETADNDGYTIAEWNSSPYAVAVTLNRYGGWTDIGDDPQPSVDAAGIVISNSLAVLHQPVIVMVDGGGHYVLVTGVALSSAGPDAPPLQVTIADPLAFGVGATPPSGSDGLTTMSWDAFTATYTANTAHGGVWAGQWVLIAAGIPLVG